MQVTLADIKRGEKGVITDVSSIHIPLKLLEMGCLPGNSVELVQVAPFTIVLWWNCPFKLCLPKVLCATQSIEVFKVFKVIESLKH